MAKTNLTKIWLRGLGRLLALAPTVLPAPARRKRARRGTGKGLVKRLVKPASQSLAKAKPAVRAAAKPVARPAAKPRARPAAKSTVRPAAQPVGWPVAKPIARSAAKRGAVRALGTALGPAVPRRRAASRAASSQVGLAGTAVRSALSDDHATTPDGGSWLRSFYSAAPGPRQFVNHLSYGLYLPTGVLAREPGPAAERRPLLVMLHGCKQTADDFARGTRMNELAATEHFAVLYPEQSLGSNAHRCWRWYDDSAAAGGLEAQSIAALVLQTIETYDLDATRVYVAGMSAGAGMATLLAIRYPHIFAALAVHSGTAFGAADSVIGGLNVMRRGAATDPLALLDTALDVAAFPGMPAIVLHGADDDVVDPVNAEQLALQWLRLNHLLAADGVSTRASVLDTPLEHGWQRDYTRKSQVVVRVCRFTGLRHAWSGGDARVPFHSDGGADSSRLIWTFCRAQQRAAAAGNAATSVAAAHSGSRAAGAQVASM